MAVVRALAMLQRELLEDSIWSQQLGCDRPVADGLLGA